MLSWSAKSQLTPVRMYRVKDSGTAFGFNISKGSKVVDLDGEQLYLAVDAIASSENIDTSLLSGLIVAVGGRGYGIVHVGYGVDPLPSAVLAGGRVLNDVTGELYVAVEDVPLGGTIDGNLDSFELVSSRYKVVAVADDTDTFAEGIEKGNRVLDEFTGLLYLADEKVVTGGSLSANAASFSDDPVTTKKYVNLRYDIIEVADTIAEFPVDVMKGNRVFDLDKEELYIATDDVVGGIGQGNKLSNNTGSFQLVSTKYKTYTQFFEETSNTPTSFVLDKTPIPGFLEDNFRVSLNGMSIKSGNFTYDPSAKTITMKSTIPVEQYDELAVTYLSIE